MMLDLLHWLYIPGRELWPDSWVLPGPVAPVHPAASGRSAWNSSSQIPGTAAPAAPLGAWLFLIGGFQQPAWPLHNHTCSLTPHIFNMHQPQGNCLGSSLQDPWSCQVLPLPWHMPVPKTTCSRCRAKHQLWPHSRSRLALPSAGTQAGAQWRVWIPRHSPGAHPALALAPSSGSAGASAWARMGQGKGGVCSSSEHPSRRFYSPHT